MSFWAQEFAILCYTGGRRCFRHEMEGSNPRELFITNRRKWVQRQYRSARTTHQSRADTGFWLRHIRDQIIVPHHTREETERDRDTGRPTETQRRRRRQTDAERQRGREKDSDKRTGKTRQVRQTGRPNGRQINPTPAIAHLVGGGGRRSWNGSVLLRDAEHVRHQARLPRVLQPRESGKVRLQPVPPVL